MGIRETLNENKGVSVGATIGIIVLAIGFMIWNISGGKPSGDVGGAAKGFFSDDDGKTFFVDSDSNIAPYDHKGKQAVGAVVFQTASGKEKFVAYLYRYTPDGKKKLESARNSSTEIFNKIEYMEVKKTGTGDSGWVKAASPAAMEIQSVKSPSGSSEELMPAIAE